LSYAINRNSNQGASIKITNSKRAGEKASVFLVALGMTALFALVLGSYLTLVEGQADSVARSQSYNTVIPVAEAGVEEALSLINKTGGATTWTNNLTGDGWSEMTASNTTTKSNLVFGANYYQVTISNAPGGTPTITSTGVVPYIEHAWGAQVASTTSYDSTLVALVRTLQIQTALSPLALGALESKGDITFSGGANVDSFDSANPSLSTNGQYNVNMRDDKAIVASDGRVVSSIFGTGDVDIRGFVNTGPGGTIGSSGNVSIGEMAWVNSGINGIEPSRSNDNFNVTFPDVAAPSATFVESPPSGTVAGTNYALVFQGNQYWGTSNVMYRSSLSMSGHEKAIAINGAVVLYIPNGGSFSTSGQSFIYVAPGASLSIYCGASSASLSGRSFVGATNATNISVYGLPSLTSIHYSGGSPFVGTIYAPEANFESSGDSTFIGALMANTFDFSGPTTIHYDENLANTGPSTGFVASNWQEVATPVALQDSAP
jgi:hypothetical protein